MPSFDVVSEIEMQEVRNAVDQASRELDTRFDFRGVDASFVLADGAIELRAPEEFQLGQMLDILRDKLTRRKVDPDCLTPEDIEGAGKQKRQRFGLIQGIDADSGRQIAKLIKGSRLKVQAAVQGEKVRVSGKKRDDLQQVMALLREAELGLPLQFNNFRD
jgi:cyclic-di-GMP-binding protein